MLPAATTGLAKDSIANASQLLTIDRRFLSARVGKLAPKRLDQILTSIDVVLGR